MQMRTVAPRLTAKQMMDAKKAAKKEPAVKKIRTGQHRQPTSRPQQTGKYCRNPSAKQAVFEKWRTSRLRQQADRKH